MLKLLMPYWNSSWHRALKREERGNLGSFGLKAGEGTSFGIFMAVSIRSWAWVSLSI